MDRIDPARDADWMRTLINTKMNLRVPQSAGKLLSGYTTGGLSRGAQLHGETDYNHMKEEKTCI
jgi:hypothetical protein